MRAVLRRIRSWVDLEQSSLERALKEVTSFASGRLLDVGCGNKPYEGLFGPHVTEYVGVDFAPTYRGTENEVLNRADRIYDGEFLPYSDQEFQTVLCTQVLEHSARPWTLFSECVRVLEPGGSLILTVPFSFRIHSEPHDYFRFTKYGLSSLAEANGLEVSLIKARGGFWYVIGQKVASHLALHVGGLGASLQEAGGLTYEGRIRTRPRYWALPLVIPGIFFAVGMARLLEAVDLDDRDTLGYLLVAKRIG